jgi:hypothetical protein
MSSKLFAGQGLLHFKFSRSEWLLTDGEAERGRSAILYLADWIANCAMELLTDRSVTGRDVVETFALLQNICTNFPPWRYPLSESDMSINGKSVRSTEKELLYLCDFVSRERPFFISSQVEHV